ncbi:MAG: hypothetical protein E6K83_08105 [Thaumarchaeota archaeon]|nr:MAG: hypothetical protein E6K83_08105 [Nitrososphaerota archaeon]
MEYIESGRAIDTVPRFGRLELIGGLFGFGIGMRLPGIGIGPVDVIAFAVDGLTVIGANSIEIITALKKIV